MCTFQCAQYVSSPLASEHEIPENVVSISHNNTVSCPDPMLSWGTEWLLNTSRVDFNSLTTSWKFFLGYGYLLWSVFPLLLGASTGNLSQSFFDTFFGGFITLTTPSECSSLPKTAYSSRNGAPTRGEKWFYVFLCQQGEKWFSQCRPRPFYSQPWQPPCTRHVLNIPAHLLLPAKPIFKMNYTNW